MAPPVYTVGQVLAASDCNSWFVPLVAYKNADTARASTTTTSPDPDLTIPVSANANYWFEVFLTFEGSNTASQAIKWNWTVPAGSTLRYHIVCADTTGAAFAGSGGSFIATSTGISGTTGAGNLRGLSMKGTLFGGVNSGNVTLVWAPNVNEVSVVTLHVQSCMFMYRIG